MAVYSKIYEDEKILGLSSGYKSILLLGCGGCANESLAFTNHTPIYVATKGNNIKSAIEKSEVIPYSVKSECERIKQLLEKRGHYVLCSLIPLSQNTLCIRHSGPKYSFNPDNQFVPDVILTVSCSAGAYGIYEDVNKSVPVYSIMQSCGQLAYYYEDLLGERKIVYDKSDVIY